jgi:hypothetical protein
MSRIPFGGPGDIPPVDICCEGDQFENVIRAYGVVSACEWFGHAPGSEFTADAINTLRERSAIGEPA